MFLIQINCSANALNSHFSQMNFKFNHGIELIVIVQSAVDMSRQANSFETIKTCPYQETIGCDRKIIQQQLFAHKCEEKLFSS